jgi:hypothetical protein
MHRGVFSHKIKVVKYAYFIWYFQVKYLYMNLLQKRFEKQSNTLYEVSYAILQQPTNATFVSKEIIQIDEEKEGLRQTGQNVYAKSEMAENTEAERQEKETYTCKTV